MSRVEVREIVAEVFHCVARFVTTKCLHNRVPWSNTGSSVALRHREDTLPQVANSCSIIIGNDDAECHQWKDGRLYEYEPIVKTENPIEERSERFS